MASTSDINPTCSQGGDFYACGNGPQFLGCCNSNPCSNGGCPDSDLEPAFFNTDQYGKFANQACANGLWYTCQQSGFMGCCTTDACSSSDAICPGSSLRQAKLSPDPNSANEFSPEPPLPSISLDSSSLTTMTQTATSSSTTSATTTLLLPTTTLGSSDGSSTSHTAAITGGVVGGVVVLGLLLATLFWRWHKYLNHSRQHMQHARESKAASHFGILNDSGDNVSHSNSKNDASASVALIADHLASAGSEVSRSVSKISSPGLQQVPFKENRHQLSFISGSDKESASEIDSNPTYRPYSRSSNAQLGTGRDSTNNSSQHPSRSSQHPFRSLSHDLHMDIDPFTGYGVHRFQVSEEDEDRGDDQRDSQEK